MDIDRLIEHAGHIVAMFKHVCETPKGIDLRRALLYAAGMAGMACHMAVKQTGKPFVVAGTADGRSFYLGDALNAYLLEGQYSVLSLCNGFFSHYAEGEEKPDAMAIVANVAQNLGNDSYRIWNQLDPDAAYRAVKDCWVGIYDNMTGKYCETPDEMPVLFAIVLQNIMATAAQVAPKPAVYAMALECACYIAKMDDDSLKSK